PAGMTRPRPAVAVALALVLAAGAARADTAAPAKPAAAEPAKAASESKPLPRILEPIAPKLAAPILGTQAQGPEGDDMGLVVDVVFDRNARPTAVVIDFGGFLGVGSRKIAIDWRLVRIKPGAKSPVRVWINRADLEGAPEFDATADSNRMVGPVAIER